MIPIYRAKKMRSDEYVIGLVSEALQVPNNTIVWMWNKDGKYYIDPSTLAIHFPDMLDSDGKKIFASLSEDGKGGDNIVDNFHNFGDDKIFIVYKDCCFKIVHLFDTKRKGTVRTESYLIKKIESLKVIGIQQ